MHLVVHAWERYVRIVAAPFSEEYRGQFRLKYADDFERLRVFYNGGRHVRRILADIGYKRFGMGLTSVSEGVWSLAAVCTDAFYTELGDYVAAKLRSYSDDDGPQTVADVVALEPPGHDLDRRLKVVWGAPPDQTIVFVRAENNGGRVVLGALDLLALVKLVGERGILPKASDAPETTAAAKRNFEVDPDDHTVRADSDSLNAEDVWQLLDVIGYDADMEARTFKKFCTVSAVEPFDPAGTVVGDILVNNMLTVPAPTAPAPFDPAGTVFGDILVNGMLTVPAPTVPEELHVHRNLLTRTVFASPDTFGLLSEVVKVASMTPRSDVGIFIRTIEFNPSKTTDIMGDLRALLDILTTVAPPAPPIIPAPTATPTTIKIPQTLTDPVNTDFKVRSLDLRSEPPVPENRVSPWNHSSNCKEGDNGPITDEPSFGPLFAPCKFKFVAEVM